MLHSDLLYLLAPRIVEGVHIAIDAVQIYILVKISFEIITVR